MTAPKKRGKTSSQVITSDRRVADLDALSESLGVAPGRVLDTLLELRSVEELTAFAQAQAWHQDKTKPAPVLLDAAVVAAISGQLALSFSSLLGPLLIDVLQVAIPQAFESRPQILQGVVNSVIDRMIAEQDQGIS
jgi:hypothetical protein